MSARRTALSICAPGVLAALAAAACDAGVMSSDRMYREHPAAEAPMIYAPSRLHALDNEMANGVTAPARATSISIEPTRVRARLVGDPPGTIVELRYRDGAWSTETDTPSFITRDELAGKGTFVTKEAQLGDLPARIRTVVWPLIEDGSLGVGARVNEVAVHAGEGGIETELDIGDGDKQTRIVLDGNGNVLRKSVKPYR